MDRGADMASAPRGNSVNYLDGWSKPMRLRAPSRPGRYYGLFHSRTFHSADAWLAGFTCGPSTISVFQKIAIGLL
jgi:hypothetical protein